MEPEQHLAATLFTATGKMATVIARLDCRSAAVAIGDGWAEGSVAILTRRGMRLFGTLRRDEHGAALFVFDDPLDDWQRDVVLDQPCSRRPIVIRERIAA